VQQVKESQQEYRGGKSGVKYLLRGPRIDWGVILLLPGERLDGHYHLEVEETFYVIEGNGVLAINGAEYPAAPGDAFRLEANDKHGIVNNGANDFKLVFIKSPYLPKDKVDL
jgi:quercetin dioxygenase-like cupin family protein